MTEKGGDAYDATTHAVAPTGAGQWWRNRRALGREDALYARRPAFRVAVQRAQTAIGGALAAASPWSVSYSGGKDSLCLLALVRDQAPGAPGVFVDSGAEFPETLAFVAATPNVVTVHPTLTLLDMYQEVGDFGSEARTPDSHWAPGQVKQTLIQEPLAWANGEYSFAGNFTGLRAEESAGRSKLGAVRRGQAWRMASGVWRCEPLTHWTVSDVWAYIAERELVYNPVYDRLAEMGVPRSQWRVAPYAGGTANHLGRWSVLRRGWPDLFNRFAARFPEVVNYT